MQSALEPTSLSGSVLAGRRETVGNGCLSAFDKCTVLLKQLFTKNKVDIVHYIVE